MADVKWIKITTNMFDNRKIKYLRKLPEGNNIVLIWVMLLTMAGRCNAGGMIFLTENIPYSTAMLADELGFEENTVKLAVAVLEELNMIATNNGFHTIAGWDEYQNIEGMDKIRESKRLAQARWREKQKSLQASSTVDSTVDSTVIQSGNAERDKEKELDSDLDLIDIKADKPQRKRFSPPSVDEVREYCFERGNNVDPEKFVDYYTANGWMAGKNKMKDWRAAVRTWERNGFDKRSDLKNGNTKGNDLADSASKYSGSGFCTGIVL